MPKPLVDFHPTLLTPDSILGIDYHPSSKGLFVTMRQGSRADREALGTYANLLATALELAGNKYKLDTPESESVDLQLSVTRRTPGDNTLITVKEFERDVARGYIIKAGKDQGIPLTRVKAMVDSILPELPSKAKDSAVAR